MQRYLHILAAGLLVTAAGLIAPQTAAQSIRWTGHYYIAVGDAAGVPAAVVGYHDGWNDARPITALAGDQFVDFAVRQLIEVTSSDLVPDHRYDVMALGNSRLGAVTVSGFESEGSPMFADDAVAIPDVGAPHSITATADGYLVVASRPPTGPILTGDYVVAYGTPDKWEVAPGPDFRGGLFTDMAAAPSSAVNDGVGELVAVGLRNEQTVVVRGVLADGRPSFDVSAEMEVLPAIARPIAIEWTGTYFVVMGIDTNGRTLLLYGRPGAWNDSKTLLTGDVGLTSLAVAPILPDDNKRGKHYDLLAIGLLKDMVVTVSGEEWIDTPMLYPDWAEVPGLGGSPNVVEPVPASAIVAGASVGAATPNPFTNRSVVAMTLSRDQAVLVEVFDAIGRRVEMLHNGTLPAGVEHSFGFDASGLPNGTYHFRINGVDFSEVRTVTLAR